VASTPAAAHNLGPLRTETVSVGPYRVVVTLYDPPRPRRPIAFAVDPAPGTTLPAAGGRPQVSAAIVPDMGQAGPTLVATVTPHQDGGVPTGGVAGTVTAPVSGNWFLSIAVRALDGTVSNGGVPLHVSEPAAIPTPVAWGLGLLPIWGLLGLVATQAWRAWRGGGSVLATRSTD
jgi:hypothetical protein